MTLKTRADSAPLFVHAQLLCASIAGNLALLSQLVAPFLRGDVPRLAAEEESLGRALEEAMLQASRITVATLEILDPCRSNLNAAERAELVRLNDRFDGLADQWRILLESVNHVWRSGKPPG